MAALNCEICGGKITASERDGWYLCESCGMEYPTEWVKKKFAFTQKVSVEGVVKVEASDSADTLAKAGDTFLGLGEYVKAEDSFQKLTTAYPSDWRGWWGLVLCETVGLTNLSESDKTHHHFAFVQKLAPKENYSEVSTQYMSYLQKVADNEAALNLREARAFLGQTPVDPDPYIVSLESKLKKCEETYNPEIHSASYEVSLRKSACDEATATIEMETGTGKT